MKHYNTQLRKCKHCKKPFKDDIKYKRVCKDCRIEIARKNNTIMLETKRTKITHKCYNILTKIKELKGDKA